MDQTISNGFLKSNYRRGMIAAACERVVTAADWNTFVCARSCARALACMLDVVVTSRRGALRARSSVSGGGGPGSAGRRSVPARRASRAAFRNWAAAREAATHRATTSKVTRPKGVQRPCARSCLCVFARAGARSGRNSPETRILKTPAGCR